MPQAINLSVVNGAAAAKTFTLLNPASGNGTPAEWALKEGANSTLFPSFTLASARTANKSRQVRLKLKVPSTYTSADTGLVVRASAFEFNGTVSVPDTYPESLKADAVAFLTSLLATAMVKDCMKDGLAAV